MRLEPFNAPGSTPTRREFWRKAFEAAMTIQKVPGRNVSVQEHKGKGTVINVRRDQVGAATGACCVGADCSIQTEAACTSMGGTYQGDDTTCDPNPCVSCVVDASCLVGCQGSSFGQPDEDTAFAVALTNWESCASQPFGCSDAFCVGAANPRATTNATRQSCTIATCGTRFTLSSSGTGSASLDFDVNTYDNATGFISGTHYSVTLATVGDYYDVTASMITPVEPSDPGPFPATNFTYTYIENVVVTC